MVKLSSSSSILNSNAQQQQQQAPTTIEQEQTKINSDSIIEKYKENKKISKKFILDPFIPGSTTVTKLKLYHNDQLDQLNEFKEISGISAFHIYKRTSRMINKRPKTAK